MSIKYESKVQLENSIRLWHWHMTPNGLTCWFSQPTIFSRIFY